MEYNRRRITNSNKRKPPKVASSSAHNREKEQTAHSELNGFDRYDEYNEENEPDVGFDVEGIPMAPRKSSDIRGENQNAAPAHRDIPLRTAKSGGQSAQHKSHDTPPKAPRTGKDVRRDDLARQNRHAEDRGAVNAERTRTSSRRRSGKRLPAEDKKLRLIDGGKLIKLKERRKALITAAISLVIILAVIVAAAVTPASLLELMQNNLTSFGSGNGFPIQVSDTRTLGMQTRNGTVFALTDTRLCAYNRSGKLVSTVQHGYSDPVLCISDSRTLVYDRGGMKMRIDTLNTNIANKTLSQKIVTAAISDSGNAAVVTDSDKSATQLVVADKSFSTFTAWKSTERIAAVTFSRNGKRAAVSTVVSDSGNFKSVVYLLDVSGDSITQLSQIDFPGVPIVTLKTVGKRAVAVGTDFISSFDFDGSGRVDKKVDYLSRVDFQHDGRVLILNNPSNNIQETKITVTDGLLTEQYSYVITEKADSACITDDGVAVVRSNKLFMYNQSGKFVSKCDIGYEGTRLSPYLDGSAVLSDMQVGYYKFGKGDES